MFRSAYEKRTGILHTAYWPIANDLTTPPPPRIMGKKEGFTLFYNNKTSFFQDLYSVYLVEISLVQVHFYPYGHLASRHGSNVQLLTTARELLLSVLIVAPWGVPALFSSCLFCQSEARGTPPCKPRLPTCETKTHTILWSRGSNLKDGVCK